MSEGGMYYKDALSEPLAHLSKVVTAGGRQTAPPRLLWQPLHRVALFLDVDGTLAPITARPEFTRVPVDTRRTLLALQARGVAIAALSGRPLNQVRRLLLPLQLHAAGSHGAQLRPTPAACIRSTVSLPPGLAHALQERIAGLPGVWLEGKPSALAIHWRQAPQFKAAVGELAAGFLQHAPSWQLIEGHCVHELRGKGRDKGVALQRLMRRPEFRGRWPLAIGDDRTDEDAFAAALALGGGAIRVGAGGATRAPWVLPDTASLAHWLRAQLNRNRR